MFFIGNKHLKHVQKVMNNPERYDSQELLSIEFTCIMMDAGFETTSEHNLIRMLIYNKINRYFYPDVEPLTLDEETAKIVHPRMTEKGLRKLRDKIIAKGLKIDI